jgi:small conductance mechanosensitive channel
MSPSDLLNVLPIEQKLIASAAVVAIISVGYKLLSQFISRNGKRIELEPHALNGIRLVLRVIAIMATTTLLFGLWELPTEWFVGTSALIGAFLGFGSSQTINNVVAGFYVLISQPFKVKDYVKIGALEGQVEEITINYTNLYTPTFNLLKVPNIQVMNSRILNITHEGFIKYTFTVGFDHSISNNKLMEECLNPALEEFHLLHEDKQLRKPEAYLDSSDRVGKKYLIRIFIPKGGAKDLYVLQPELLDRILEHYYNLKNAQH